MNQRSVVNKPVAICQTQTYAEMVTSSTGWSTDAWTGKHGDVLHGALGIAKSFGMPSDDICKATIRILEGFCMPRLSVPAPPSASDLRHRLPMTACFAR
jgi:hypothetical protein